MHTLTSILRWLFRLPYKPSYAELAQQVATLEKDVTALRCIARRAMLDLEQTESMLLRHSAVQATVMRWPRAQRLMTQGRVMVVAEAVERRRSRHRFQFRRFCERYGLKVPEFNND